MVHVKSVKSLGDFRLRIAFDDGSAGEHDFVSMVNESGPMVEPLRDPNYFQRVFLDFGALTWPNGFDACPDWRHQQMERAGELSREAAE